MGLRIPTQMKSLKHTNMHSGTKVSKLSTCYFTTLECFTDFTESVAAAINYYRCAFQHPELSEALLKKVTVPVLSIFGTADKHLSVEAAKGSRRYVDNLTEDYIDGVGHWVQMEAANRVNKSIEEYLSKSLH